MAILDRPKWQHEIPKFLLLFTDFFILSDSKLSLITKSAHKNTNVSLSFYGDRRKYPSPPSFRIRSRKSAIIICVRLSKYLDKNRCRFF